MNTPGFTAEASLYKTTAEYHSRTARQGRWTGDMGDNKGRVVPQRSWICDTLLDWCADGYRNCCDAYIMRC
jgi:hypothetical protein